MKNALYKLQIVFGLLFVISSCKKQESLALTEGTKKTEIKVENGHLVFRSLSELSDFQQKVNSLNNVDRLKGEKEIGFQSLYSLFDELKAKVETSNSITEINSLLIGYENLFSYSDKGLSFKNENDFFAKIIDKNGLFKVGEALYKSIDKGRLIATTKNFTQLQSINSIDEYIVNADDEIKIDRFATKADFINSLTHSRTDADPYTAGTNKYYLISVRNESNNRRLYVDMIQYIGYFPQYTGSTFTGFGVNGLKTLGFSHTKKGTFGIWSSYTSPTYIADLSMYSAPQNIWNVLFAGTLNNNSSQQSYSDGANFGYTSPIFYYPPAAAINWVEPIFTIPTKITCTGNGQNWYFNSYL